VKDKKINWIAVFGLIILPFILSLYLFNPWEKIDLETINKKGSTYIKVPESFIYSSGWENSIRNIFSVPFDLERYNLFFESKGVIINYQDRRELKKNVSYTITLGDREINISEGIIPYGPIELEKEYKYELVYSFPIRLRKSDVIYSLDEIKKKGISIESSFHVYARPIFSEVGVKIILVMISWWSLYLLVNQILSIILKIKDK
jgi:hypothetical protein